MQNSRIVTNVKITDYKKAEAFINALDKAANAPYKKKERGDKKTYGEKKKCAI